MRLPIIDVAPLRQAASSAAEKRAVGSAIDTACRDHGFFYACGHGVDPALLGRVLDLGRAFFALPPAAKGAMSIGARGSVHAFRGYQPCGANVTQGRPDRHEAVDWCFDSKARFRRRHPIAGHSPPPA